MVTWPGCPLARFSHLVTLGKSLNHSQLALPNVCGHKARYQQPRVLRRSEMVYWLDSQGCWFVRWLSGSFHFCPSIVCSRYLRCRWFRNKRRSIIAIGNRKQTMNQTSGFRPCCSRWMPQSGPLSGQLENTTLPLNLTRIIQTSGFFYQAN